MARTSSLTLLALATAGAVAALVTPASGAAPRQACARSGHHRLVVIFRVTCPKGWRAIVPKRGPQGPAGVQGPAGPAGPAGATGPAGAAGATGPAGTSIPLRARLAGAQPLTGTPTAMPLALSTWTQAADGVDWLLGPKAAFTPPATCTTGGSPIVLTDWSLDGTLWLRFAAAMTPGGPATLVTVPTVPTIALPLPSLDTPKQHTLTLTASTNCTGPSEVGTLSQAGVDVVEFR